MSVERDIALEAETQSEIDEREYKEELAYQILCKGEDVSHMLCQQVLLENMPDHPKYDAAIIQAMQGNNSLLLKVRDATINGEPMMRGMIDTWGYELNDIPLIDLRRMNGEKLAA
ncbi:hypothetical protein R84981_002856 [Carnimonas sp. R-84981]|uniref:hypothetical protein n=1 Tax=Carnimonas bestiolae TaxID=3402172 RepID=UPI003EDBCB89